MAHSKVRIGRERYRTEVEVGPHRLVIDEPEELGGQGLGPSPYDMILSGLGACTAITLRMYADRKTWPLEAISVDLRLTREGDAMLIERTVDASGLDATQKARLLDIAERTPVTLSLKAGFIIQTRLL